MAQLHPIGNHRPDSAGDIVFVHGLGGHWRETWAANPQQEKTYWPKWLADDIPQANVWSLEYEAHRSQWRGGMSLIENADYVLELLVTKGLGRRPLFFVAHSLGGLLVKSLLRAGCDAPDGKGAQIASATRGVVFFATPNSGARLASVFIRLLGWLGPLGQLYRAAPLVYELRAHTPELLRLNRWYRDHTADKGNGLKITTKVYYEKRGIALGLLPIVDESSADPGVAGIRPVPVPADHFSISKFAAQGDWLYANVRQFFEDLFLMEVRADSSIASGKIIELRLRERMDGEVTSEPLVRSIRQVENELLALPEPVPGFKGREEELANLEAALTREGRAVISIEGLGGIGKTALAIQAAHRLAPQFPDGVVFLDLRGGSQQPATAENIMKEVLTLLAPTARVPEDAELLLATFQKVLTGKRMLLVLDDVRDAAQVNRLAPPEPVAVLITSRSPIALESAKRWELDTLTADEAVALLREILRGRPDVGEHELRALADRCGYLPLALRIAGGFLASRPSWSVEDYLKALRDPLENTRTLNIRELFALQLDQLMREDMELPRLYRILAVFPVGFLPNAAAAVWQMSETKARETLETLATRSLVDLDQSTNHFYLHDLLRGLAAEGLDPDERERAAARHAEHYVEVLRNIDGLYSDGQSLQQALALFDAERANIETGQAWAAANLALSPRAADLAFQYTDVGGYVLNLRLPRPQWVAWLETAVEACRKLGNRQGEASALGNLGLAWESLGDIRKAIGFYKQHLAVARQLGDRRGEASALGNLGVALASLGDIHKAITLHKRHLAIARELGDRRSEGNALGNLGLACASLGEIRKAADFYVQHLAIARELGDRRSEGNALGNLGLAYASWGDIRKATEFYEQHLAIARELGDRRGEASALSNLGNAAFSQGDLSLAAKAYEEAIAIARQIGDRLREERNLGNLGNVYRAAGEINSAVYSYNRQLELSRIIGDRHGEGNALWNSALALEELGEREQAIANAKAALAIRHQVRDPNAAKVAEWLRERETTRT